MQESNGSNRGNGRGTPGTLGESEQFPKPGAGSRKPVSITPTQSFQAASRSRRTPRDSRL